MPAALFDSVVLERQNARHIELIDELEASAQLGTDGLRRYTISVPAMHCGLCVATTEKTLGAEPGVKNVRANLSLRRIHFVTDGKANRLKSALEALARVGYAAQSTLQGTN